MQSDDGREEGRRPLRRSDIEERHANDTGMDGSQTSTSLSSTMAMFPFHPFFLSSLSLPPFVRPFILISAPPVRESLTTGGGSASYVGCKGHPWGNCTEVARESATYESWESGAASKCFLRSMLHLFVTP